jgi:hypothetical protein
MALQFSTYTIIYLYELLSFLHISKEDTKAV